MDESSERCLRELAEFRYTLARKYDRPTADEYPDWLTDLVTELVDVGNAWMDASEYVLEYDPALGDSFALGDRCPSSRHY